MLTAKLWCFPSTVTRSPINFSNRNVLFSLSLGFAGRGQCHGLQLYRIEERHERESCSVVTLHLTHIQSSLLNLDHLNNFTPELLFFLSVYHLPFDNRAQSVCLHTSCKMRRKTYADGINGIPLFWIYCTWLINDSLSIWSMHAILLTVIKRQWIIFSLSELRSVTRSTPTLIYDFIRISIWC